MSTFINGYQNYKLDCKAVIPGLTSSTLWAYCKTLNVPDNMEPCYTRKTVSFVKLAKYVRQHITNDFDLWYRKNEDGRELMEVLSNIINDADGRSEAYQPKKLVSEPFYISGFSLPMVLVSKY